MKFGQGTSSFDALSSPPIILFDELSMSQGSWSNFFTKHTIIIKITLRDDILGLITLINAWVLFHRLLRDTPRCGLTCNLSS